MTFPSLVPTPAVPDRRLPSWLLSRWAMGSLLLVLMLAVAGTTYDYARRREAALAWLEAGHGSVNLQPLPKWCPRWAPPPRWMRSVVEVHWKTRVDFGPLLALHEIRECSTFDGIVDADGLRSIGRIHGLERVSFARTQIADGALALLAPCPRLRSLRLSESPVSNDALRQLTGLSLRRLALDGTEITDDGLVHLAGLSLEHLNLARTHVTAAGLTHLADVPLRSLDLSDTLLGDAGLKTLNPLQLEVLSLRGTQVTDAGLRHLSALPLKHLDLSRTRITDAGLSHLAALPIEHLSVCDTDVTADGLMALSAISTLQSVSATWPLISTTDVARLGAAHVRVSLSNSER